MSNLDVSERGAVVAQTEAGTRPGGSPRPRDAGERRMLWLGIAAGAALITTLIVLFVHRESPRTLVSAHGLLHSAIAERFANVAIPTGTPENPFFAGESLPYYWLFHYIGAKLGSLFDVHPLVAFELLALAALWVIWLAAAQFGRRLYGSWLAGLMMGFLVFAGADGLGAWIFLGKVTLGGASIPSDGGGFLWGIAHPLLGRLGFGDRFALYQPLLLFFINITSRPLALAMLLLTAWGLWSWLERGTGRSWIALLAASAACTAFSPLIGFAVAGSLAGGLVLVALLGRVRGAVDGSTWMRRALLGAAAVVLGTLIPAPTYVTLFTQAGGPGLELGVRRPIAMAVASGAFLLVVMGVIATLRSMASRRRYLTVLLLACGALLAAATIVQLPAGNDSNFFHAAALLLAVAAAGVFAPEVMAESRRRLVAVALVAALLPTTAAVVYSFTGRAPIALRFEDARLVRTPRNESLARFYAWTRAETPANAVFITDPRTVVAAGGNMPELPALTGRFLFAAHETSYMVEPHADAALRLRIATQLADGRTVSSQDLAYMRSLGRPLYLVAQGAAADRMAAMQSQFGSPAFAASDLAVFSVR